MKRAILAATIMSVAAASVAQSSSGIDTSGLRLRFGAAYPLDNSSRNIIKRPFAIGVDFDLNQPVFGRGGKGFITLEYQAKALKGGKPYQVIATINQRMNLDDNIEGKRAYYYLGAGAVLMDLTKSKVAFAARGGLGKEFGQNLFGEVGLLVSTDANRANANQVAVYLGWRF